MRLGFAAVGALAMASMAQASDTPLYQPPPPWAEIADLAKAQAASTGPLVIRDVQVRVEGDKVTAYVDNAIRIDSPQALTQLGTLSALWLPDKGDLIVHRAELVRDGAAIDLLKDQKFTVLRREAQLEQRTLTGMLTATMPLAGARVGDIVRLSYSISVADKALKGQVQRGDVLPYFPLHPGVGRYRISWPADRAITVRAGPRFALPAPVQRGSYKQIELALPAPKPDDMPGDAPGRYARPAAIELSSFADWKSVSTTMAPLFATDGTIAADGPIAAEVAKIKAASSDPQVRAARALRLVQDRIAYLANGMDGGNYVPQSPATTWETRYGDCKAKSLLLLAMLRQMDIPAEAVLVSATRGDQVFEDLPFPAAFNHVIIHAMPGGHDLWLDGTTLGTRQGDLSDPPPFGWGLPLKPEGADLLQIKSRAPAAPVADVVERIDASAGVDLPAPFELVAHVNGAAAALAQQVLSLPEGKERNEALDGMVGAIVKNASVATRAFVYDAESGVGTLTASGLLGSPFDMRSKRATLTPPLPSADLALAGNRSKAAWRDIPILLPAPDNVRYTVEYTLPNGGQGFSLEGGTFSGTALGATVARDAALADGKLVVHEALRSDGGELAADAIAAERPKLAALKASEPKLSAPADAPRSWELKPADRARLKRVEDTFAALIAGHPDQAVYYVGRASYYAGLRDGTRALADYDKALALDPQPDWYQARAGIRQWQGDLAGAEADLRKAIELDPGGERTASLATVMGLAGEAATALPLVEAGIAQGGDSKPSLVAAQADLLARLGRPAEGLSAFASLAEDRPGDGNVLNARCWFEALWQVGMDGLAKDCDAAVNASNYAPEVLDSRAVANLRLGKLAAALADANAALSRNGGQDQTLLVRGIIRTKMGEAGGASDIAEALRRRPGLRAEYAGYGLLPAK